MKNLIISGVVLLGVLLVLSFIGFNIKIVFEVIEWITKFIFPWVALYWLIRVVRTLEIKS